MRLTDLHPEWIDHGGEGISYEATGLPVPHQHGVGVMFDCPCGTCGTRCFVPFSVALDGTPYDTQPVWQRTGDTFDTLRLTPSIQRRIPCTWHGFIGQNVPGEVTTV